MSVRVTELPGGLRIVTHRMETVETVSLGVWVHVGTRFETADMDDRGLREGDLADVIGKIGRRHSAIEREARAGEVAAIIAPQRNPCAVGDARFAVRQQRLCCAERGELVAIGRRVLFR